MDLELVTVVQEVVPIQMISVVTPPAPTRRTPKRKLKLPVGSDDEIVETEPDVENVVEQQREKTTADDVDKIIDQVISETEKMETDMEAPSLTRSDDIIVEITERSMMRMIILMELKMKLLGN
ncbi:pentatricopeptide repeat-containing protein mitochondrial-like [Dorcoceras hygrometricum]|uniref:Pentatricopeptide repeat-containing protein mitochondrial-like n=1 Tax=Dorcoceras hygrometricum TaxID=472368 RepID=A0A2Z7B4P0_9LAMI|nr:pentatricopeptide repeat-containing protein mitochondrial-like [Dorcoceras hygrometricum]